MVGRGAAPDAGVGYLHEPSVVEEKGEGGVEVTCERPHNRGRSSGRSITVF